MFEYHYMVSCYVVVVTCGLTPTCGVAYGFLSVSNEMGIERTIIKNSNGYVIYINDKY